MKLVVFDVDGVISDDIFVWRRLHDYFGIPSSVYKQAHKKFYAGEMSYDQWVQHDIGKWIEKGATKEKIVDAIKDVKLIKGVVETLKELKKKGYKIAVISGSINLILEKILPDYEDYFDYVFLNKIVFDDSGKIVKVEPTKFDEEDKATGLKHIAKKEGMELKDCVFVGDDENDLSIAETAGFTIAFNCKSDRLAEIADVVIEKKDLREVLKYVK